MQTELSSDPITEEVSSEIVSRINGLTESAKLFRFSTRHSFELVELVAKQLGIGSQAKNLVRSDGGGKQHRGLFVIGGRLAEIAPLEQMPVTEMPARRKRRSKFSSRDLTTATKAVGRAGVSISRFEIEPNGKIVMVTDKGGAPLDDDLNRELAEFEARHAR